MSRSRRTASPGAHDHRRAEAKNTAAAIALAAHAPARGMRSCWSARATTISPTSPRSAPPPRAAARLAADDWLVVVRDHPDRARDRLRLHPRGARSKAATRSSASSRSPTSRPREQFLADGGYSWNGGIFAFRAGRFLDELRRHRPALVARRRARQWRGARRRATASTPMPRAFAAIEPESVDYAVMEKTDRAAMVPASMGWSDIGSWARAARRDRQEPRRQLGTRARRAGRLFAAFSSTPTARACRSSGSKTWRSWSTATKCW